MKLRNEMVLQAPLEQAWTLLTDLERIAPAMPGATLEKVDGDVFHGVVAIKVGPINLKYRGTAQFVEVDEGSHRAVIAAKGKDASGQGGVQATIYAHLEPAGHATKVVIETDLSIAGRLAQFGSSAISDVSNRLMGQFVENIASLTQPLDAASDLPASAEIAAGRETSSEIASEPATDSAAASESAPRPAAPAPSPMPAAAAPTGSAGSVDGLSLIAPIVARRLAPVFVGIVIGWVLARMLRRG